MGNLGLGLDALSFLIAIDEAFIANAVAGQFSEAKDEEEQAGSDDHAEDCRRSNLQPGFLGKQEFSRTKVDQQVLEKEQHKRNRTGHDHGQLPTATPEHRTNPLHQRAGQSIDQDGQSEFAIGKLVFPVRRRECDDNVLGPY